ncbi:hypothetical protein Q7P37_002421 [Cladosporium fusiforme]
MLVSPYKYKSTPKRAPSKHSPVDVAPAPQTTGLPILTLLQKHHITSIPFENLELHYSPTKTIVPDATHLFDKIITQSTGRGGYCMENNLFFGTLLRSLGFSVMSTGARVNAASPEDVAAGVRERFTGWSHMINIVTFEGGRRFMVDVGFGTGQATRPVELVDQVASLNVPPSQSVRLRWGSLEENEDPESKLWIFEGQNESSEDWKPTYCFPDHLEFLPADFAVANHFTSTSRTSFFTYQVMVVKFLFEEGREEEEREIVGTVVMVGNKAHRRVKGVKEELGVFEREVERVEVLEREFGIALSGVQREGIRGMVSALGS